MNFSENNHPKSLIIPIFRMIFLVLNRKTHLSAGLEVEKNGNIISDMYSDQLFDWVCFQQDQTQ